jgi:hypothetical protein
MISSVLTLLLAASSAQASDTTRTARLAFTTCLRTYVDESVGAGMAPAAFTTAYPQQCTAQEAAFRAAVIARENGLRATRANAEQSARDEIGEARTNFSERFEMSLPAPAATPAAAPVATADAAAPAATPAAAPAATPASAATTPH